GITLPENLVRIDGEQRIRALSLAGEAARLLVSLDECGIRAIVLKGPLLSQIIYDDPAMRQSADLDLLVDWDQFRSAREALSSHGYQLFTNEPPWDDWRIEPWRRLAKDITLFHPEREISLELHHRLKSPDTLLPGIGVAQATQSITMAGREFAAFERADLFAYLCTHAATSFWDRLKWLADLRAFLAGCGTSEIADLQAHSERLGTGRCTALGLILCHRLWNQKLPQSVLDRVTNDQQLVELEHASIARLLSPERQENSLANSLDRRLQLLLRDDPAYKRSLAAEFFNDKELLEERRIPRKLRFLYLPLRVVLFLSRKLGWRKSPIREAFAAQEAQKNRPA
ncbi:MAG: nucleotidyltransferase family protein, partial [Pseudomonadota bacterium]